MRFNVPVFSLFAINCSIIDGKFTKKNEIKERFNLFQYKTVDFTLRLNIYKRKAQDKTSTLADI